MSTTSDRQAIIACEHVFMAYGRQEVLYDVCLEIRAGTLLPFVGPNGAGKTTLLRAILGLLKPRRGVIRTPFHRSAPGYVPQQQSIDPLYPVSTRQIVEMGLFPQLGWWRRPNGAQRKMVDEALERFGLAGHAAKTIGELSGGMRQKALLARALVSGAEVFIMDEPTSELDEQSEKEVLEHFTRLCGEQGKTVLIAHHGMHDAGALAAQVCLVNHGRVRLVSADRMRAEMADSKMERTALL
ncbi:MAG: ATP-binding cassette domain-containing protein [Verrucomicrobiota bacterium]